MMACVKRCLKTHYPTMGYFAMGLAIAGILGLLLTPGIREAGVLSAAFAIGVAKVLGVTAGSTVLLAFMGCVGSCIT